MTEETLNKFIGMFMICIALFVTTRLAKDVGVRQAEERILERCTKHAQVMVADHLIYCALEETVIESMKSKGYES